MKLPTLGSSLNRKQIALLDAFTLSARRTIIEMLKQSQSGHPGGALGCVDYLSLLYTYIISQTGEKVVISNGHISPAVYAVLAELGVIKKDEVIKKFRKSNGPFEGHVTRFVRGIDYGTGPLGAGIAAAAGFALGEKIKKTDKHVFALLGDGESQEGQVYETINFAAKYKLDNFIVFMDYNHVQLTDSLEQVMPINPKKVFLAAGWHVIDVNGHDYAALWKALGAAHKVKGKPTLLLASTVMGKGVDFMEAEGKKHKATWHGKAPKAQEADNALADLTVSKKQKILLKELHEEALACLVVEEKHKKLISDFCKRATWRPKVSITKPLTKLKINTGKRRVYKVDELTDCRSAYGNALLDLAKKNKSVMALTADLSGSVKTDGVKKNIPERHVDVGIAEQLMVSAAGGLSLNGFIPFCSTFGVFMTSRAKDQARLNDLNETNVKMVTTHNGLSLGKDGPTHQAIDDSSSMLGLFNTMQMEPSDPNHCDRMIRYVASHYGNFYVRMGRHKLPVLTKENGKPFYDEKYKYSYGKCDLLRKGSALTIVATGPMGTEALKAREMLESKGYKGKVEIVIASSIKKFDNTVLTSIKKTRRVVTIEDHNAVSGLGSQLASVLVERNIPVQSYTKLGVQRYHGSDTPEMLYNNAKISATHIAKKCVKILDTV